MAGRWLTGTFGDGNAISVLLNCSGTFASEGRFRDRTSDTAAIGDLNGTQPDWPVTNSEKPNTVSVLLHSDAATQS
jgi:hypothetical protein